MGHLYKNALSIIFYMFLSIKKIAIKLPILIIDL